MDRVILTKKAVKDIKSLPQHIKERFFNFIETIEDVGYIETLKYPSYKDESLIGKRKGQRSARLNRSYRVIYKLEREDIDILEINKHDY